MFWLGGDKDLLSSIGLPKRDSVPIIALYSTNVWAHEDRCLLTSAQSLHNNVFNQCACFAMLILDSWHDRVVPVNKRVCLHRHRGHHKLTDPSFTQYCETIGGGESKNRSSAGTASLVDMNGKDESDPSRIKEHHRLLMTANMTRLFNQAWEACGMAARSYDHF